ncbi:MAG TPA: phosphoribosyltransferase family protein [Candidatus Paceibacterota bacterium]
MNAAIETQQDALKVLGRVGAVLTSDHFVYTSGKHGSAYVNKDAVYPYTKETARLCFFFADHFADRQVDVVVGPEKGGIILSQWTASMLEGTTGRKTLAVYAEKEDDRFVIKRGYEKLIPSKNILIVEDILTTGGSAKKVFDAVRELGGNVVGLGAICNRGGVTEGDIGLLPELYSLTSVDLDSWEATECPLCAKGVPVNTTIGKGKEFLADKQQ